MEAFHAGKLEKPRYHPHYGVKKSPHGAAFNSWNDYLGLATLIQRPEKGFRKEEEEEDLEEEEEEEELEEEEEELEEEELEEESGEEYFGAALDLRHLCSRLEQRFAGLSPFSAPPGVFHCGDALEARERFLHAPPSASLAAAAAAPPPPPPPLLLPSSCSSRGGPSARLLKPSSLQVCVFCRNNKEAVALYTTHILKGPDGRVLCPVLRRYTCPLCGASGDNAHTIKYCPLSKMHGKGPPPPLKSARHLLGKRIR